MIVSIINIGDELLNGSSVNTNATWMCGRMISYGATPERVIIVGDQTEDILQALDDASRGADLVLISGGLGPTLDDRTKDVTLKYFGGKLIPHDESLHNIKKLFEDRKMPLTERNIEQGWVPDKATIYPNLLGTAPGMGFKKGNTFFVFLPGVPSEMKSIVENHHQEWIGGQPFSKVFVMNEMVITGISESFIADKLNVWQQQLPDWLSLAFLPSAGLVKIRLSGRHPQPDFASSIIRASLNEAIALFPGAAFPTDGKPFDAWFMEQLKIHQKTIATAESCTGGYLAHRITANPGSSAVFKGSIIAYQNTIKQQLLGVPEDILVAHGAVSEATVTIMAQRVRELFNTDIGVAISGIAGPDGGTKEKPVGTVWIATATENKIVATPFLMGTHRLRNIEKSTVSAMQMVLNQITI